MRGWQQQIRMNTAKIYTVKETKQNKKKTEKNGFKMFIESENTTQSNKSNEVKAKLKSRKIF